MYYELYIDIFFLVNFMMDHMILMLAGRMLTCSVTHGRVCLGAAAGAFLTCVIIMIPAAYASVRFILFHSIVPAAMIKIGLKIRWDRSFLKAYILLYISTCIIGGVFGLFQPYLRVGSIFFALALLSFWISKGIWNVIRYMARRKECRCEVVLYKGSCILRVPAIIDTGNTLRDPVSGDPVSVLDHKTGRELMNREQSEPIRYIPYHSIGREQGVMPVFRPDQMIVCGEDEKVITRPLVAVCEENMTADDYKMILHPELL